MIKFILPLLLCLLALVASAVSADPFRAKFNVFEGDLSDKISTRAVSNDDWSGFGNLEGRVIKPFIPATIDVGGGIGLQLTTLPKATPLLSSRKIFVDAIVSSLDDDKAFVGLAISLMPAQSDNGLRLGVKAIGPNPWKTWYLGKAFNFDW